MFKDCPKCKGTGCRDCRFSGLDMKFKDCFTCGAQPAWMNYGDYAEIWCEYCGAYAKAGTDEKCLERWNKLQLHDKN